MHYGQIVRPGLPAPFTVDGALRAGAAAVGGRAAGDQLYLDVLDENGLDPSPTDTFRDDRDTTWTFAVPDGEDVLVVDFDVRIEPTEQLRRPGATVALLVDGQVVDDVALRSWILP